jgi:hypothetical protein
MTQPRPNADQVRRRFSASAVASALVVEFSGARVCLGAIFRIRQMTDRWQLSADTGPSSGADQLAEAFDPSLPFAVAGAVPNQTQNRSGRVLSPNPSTSRCKVCVAWEAVPRCEKESFSANTIGARNRWPHHCAPPAVSNRFGSLLHIGTRPDQQPKRKQASDHSQAAG